MNGLPVQTVADMEIVYSEVSVYSWRPKVSTIN
jgi:hypothetical protein